MTIVLAEPPFSWSRTREQICIAALSKVSEIGIGETQTPSAPLMNLAIDALDGVLKMLQFQGLEWPQVSPGQSEFTIFKNQQQTALPADYYGFARINYVVQTANANGTFPSEQANEKYLLTLTSAEWHGIQNKNQTASFPTYGFIDNRNVLWVWPIPNQNVACKMFYQRVIGDSRSGFSPELRAPWMLALPYGVAVEIGEDLEVSDAKMKRLTAKWAYYLNLCLQNEAETTHFDVTVRTGLEATGGITV